MHAHLQLESAASWSMGVLPGRHLHEPGPVQAAVVFSTNSVGKISNVVMMSGTAVVGASVEDVDVVYNVEYVVGLVVVGLAGVSSPKISPKHVPAWINISTRHGMHRCMVTQTA